MDASFLERVVECAIAIQSVPAPTFHEEQRSLFVQERFAAEGLEVSRDVVGNVYAQLEGKGSAKPVVVSAHLDTVFPFSQNLETRTASDRIFGPGLGDNSLGVAGLFGLLWCLRQRGIVLPGDVWLVANVGEEGLGDLRGMRAVVERFGSCPSAYLVLEGLALGQIYHRGLGVKRYQIMVNTDGGHSWVDYGKPSAVHILGELITLITRLPLPPVPRTTVNVGVIEGGTTINTIAAQARMELDLRSESERVLESLSTQVERITSLANRQGASVQVDVIGRRPAGSLPQKHALVQLAKKALKMHNIRPYLSIGSTDANIPLSQGLPAICLGISTGGGAHTAGEYVMTQPIRQGLECLVSVVESIFREM
jgi:tripeptide aminopeptidase